MLKALPSLFPNLLGTSSSARVKFYDKFQCEADEYDRDFMKKYDEDLNTTLIFVSTSFAVTPVAVFIWFFQAYRPVCSPQSYPLSLSTFRTTSNRITNKARAPEDCRHYLATDTNTDTAFTPWGGPDPTVVHVQSILYSSLVASLLAAFIVMLGKQWLRSRSVDPLSIAVGIDNAS
jgi:hypothetical protein